MITKLNGWGNFSSTVFDISKIKKFMLYRNNNFGYFIYNMGVIYLF